MFLPSKGDDKLTKDKTLIIREFKIVPEIFPVVASPVRNEFPSSPAEN